MLLKRKTDVETKNHMFNRMHKTETTIKRIKYSTCGYVQRIYGVFSLVILNVFSDKMQENKKYLINYREGRMDCPNLEQRIGSILAHMCYKAGRDFGVELYESDVQWIENNISKNSQNNNRDILWILENSYSGKVRYSPYLMDYLITFFEKFIGMHGIPCNVNRILLYLSGYYRFWYSKKCLNSQYQHFFVEKWLETCR